MAIERAKNKDAAAGRPPKNKGPMIGIRYVGAKSPIVVSGAHTGGSSYHFIRGQVQHVPDAEWSRTLVAQPGFELVEIAKED
jgi:hypothetical protein